MRWKVSYLVAAAVAALLAVASLAVVTRPEPRPGAGYGGMMRGAMMGRGMMMGQGMMQPAAPSADGQRQGNGAAGRLAGYVQQQGLSCMGCHALTGRLAAPSFTEIAGRYAGQPQARATLARSIEQGVAGKWPGYTPMPAGLAAPDQARELSGMILDLGQ
ncbi:MAG TPA: hypothetical protein VFA95_11775 [Gammaproteobacteria bacterium]|nr:hypothetical protein [Gammaproteobacteria bacterium]